MTQRSLDALSRGSDQMGDVPSSANTGSMSRGTRARTRAGVIRGARQEAIAPGRPARDNGGRCWRTSSSSTRQLTPSTWGPSISSSRSATATWSSSRGSCRCRAASPPRPRRRPELVGGPPSRLPRSQRGDRRCARPRRGDGRAGAPARPGQGARRTHAADAMARHVVAPQEGNPVARFPERGRSRSGRRALE